MPKINKILNLLHNTLFENFQSYSRFDLLRNEGLYQGPGLHETAFIFFFVAFEKRFFFVIALVSFGKLVSVEDVPSASLREGR